MTCALRTCGGGGSVLPAGRDSMTRGFKFGGGLGNVRARTVTPGLLPGGLGWLFWRDHNDRWTAMWGPGEGGKRNGGGKGVKRGWGSLDSVGVAAAGRRAAYDASRIQKTESRFATRHESRAPRSFARFARIDGP